MGPGVGLGAAGIDIVIVRPPPGVWAGCSVPCIASVRPRDTASPSPSPSPTPVALSVSPSRWKGANILSLSASGTPGPQSITRSSIRPLLALAVSSGGDQECEHISGHRCEGEPQHHYRDDEPRHPGE